MYICVFFDNQSNIIKNHQESSKIIKNHQKSSNIFIFLCFLVLFICFYTYLYINMNNLHFLPRSCLDLASSLDLASILPRSCLGRLCFGSSKMQFNAKNMQFHQILVNFILNYSNNVKMYVF